MKNVFLLLFISMVAIANAQTDYFQQDVDYTIEVKLDEEEDILLGNIKISYTNNSKVALYKIYMHLWPNAYSGKHTAFAKARLKNGVRGFHFAREDDYGYIDSLDFKVDDKVVAWKEQSDNPDIAVIILQEDLQPGETIEVSTPFRVKLPYLFSRGGVVDDTYQICQWYPKPAVYDESGWHPMPYLDMGEFYAEFGSFDVTINVPTNYVVAATGKLIDETNDQDRKTLRFQANNVHDFAWFTDPDFELEEKLVSLESGKEVLVKCFTNGFQEEIWEDCIRYTEQSLKFLSSEVGDYPYDEFSVVQTSVEAGSGMEYPMLTSIDDVIDEMELDHVIAHEVAHSWFYGILGFNERDFPWLDEGLTTYYDNRYFHETHNDDHFSSYLPKWMKKDLEVPLINYSYQLQAARHYDQEPGLASSDYTMENYGLSSYVKPMMAFSYLESYLGPDLMKNTVQSFFEKWKFKHPQPDDLKRHFEDSTNRDLTWFFDGLMGSDVTVDLRISKKGKQFRVQNSGDINIPFKVTAFKNDLTIAEEWYESDEVGEWIEMSEEFDHIEVDEATVSLDINYKNNTTKRTLAFDITPGLDNKYGTRQMLLPSLLYNKYDGVMLGLSMFNGPLPIKKFNYLANVNYGFSSKKPVVNWWSRYNIYKNKKGISHLHFDMNVRSHFKKDYDRTTPLNFALISPSINYTFNKSIGSKNVHSLSLKSNHILEQISSAETVPEPLTEWSTIIELGYELNHSSALMPWIASIDLEQQSYKIFDDSSQNYLKLSASWDSKIYYSAERKIKLRLFAGGFLKNTRREVGSTNRLFVRGTIPLTYQGFNDYAYADYILGRYERDGIFSQQIVNKAGGFKNALTSQFGTFAQTNDLMITTNLMVDVPKLPLWLPLKIFADLGIYNEKPTSAQPFERKFLYNGGLALEWMDGAVGIYVPLIYSEAFKTNYETLDAGFLQRITFSFDLNQFNPYKAIDRFGR